MVVCVDDEKAILRAVELAGGKGRHVVTATSGLEGLRLLDRLPSPPAVVLTDLWLPDLDGVLLLERAAATHPASRLILMSGHAGSADVTAAVAAGASEVLFKPFTGQALRDALETQPDRPSPPVAGPAARAARAIVDAPSRSPTDHRRTAFGARIVATVLGAGDPEILAEAIDHAVVPALQPSSALAAAVCAAAAAVAGSAGEPDDEAVVRLSRDRGCPALAAEAIRAWERRGRSPAATVTTATAVPAGCTLAAHLIAGDVLVIPRGAVLDAARLERIRRSPALAQALAVVWRPA